MPTLTLTFTSDWRIGSGTGRPGDVDQLIRRDRNHAPFLPAKTIIGIWRDSCEQVAAALDTHQAAPIDSATTWKNWVTYLFGNQPNRPKAPQGLIPTKAHLQVSSAHLDESLIKAIANKPALQAALTFVKPGVKISTRSGTAEDQHFRLEEMARGGISLSATVELIQQDITKQNGQINIDTQKAAYALLQAGATLVERIGGKRRRGAGRCKMQLTDIPENLFENSFHDYLSKTLHPPSVPEAAPPNAEEQSSDNTAAVATHSSKDWQRFSVTLTTQQPVIISKGTVGNVVETLDYIPGSKLLPILSRYLRKRGVSAIGKAIADSQIILTNALPTQSRQFTLPTPFSLFEEKNQAKNAETVAAINKLVDDPDDGIQRKQSRGGYISQEGESSIRVTQLSTTVETHNTVEDGPQRPTSSVGGVYSYEAIPSKTVLKGELRIQSALLDSIEAATQQQDWYAGLPAHQTMGISRKDEYGQVRLTIAPWDDSESTLYGLSGQSTGQSTGQSSEELTVWLLSDLLLRDEWLQPTTTAEDLCRAIAQALQLSTDSLNLIGYASNANAASLLARHQRSDSWQTRWQLPRPSLVGFSAGSCFRFALLNGAVLNQVQIEQLQLTGLGERRVEGYGQLSINPPLLSQSKITVINKNAIKKTSTLMTEENSARENSAPSFIEYKQKDELSNYARTIEKAAWRDAISRAALTLAIQTDKRETLLGLRFDEKTGESVPRLSQLGGVRSQLSRLKSEEDEDNVVKWIKACLKKEKAPKACLKQVRDFLVDRSSDSSNEEREDALNKIWQVLDFEETLKLPTAQLCCTSAGKTKSTEKPSAEKSLNAALRLEAVETFISESIRAHTRESEARKKSANQEAAA